MIRLDDVLGYEKLKIFQNSDFFSFSLDSVILANYSNVRLRDKNIIDLCTGNAIVPLILSRRTKSKIVGVEIQKDIAELAMKSVLFNNLENQISIIQMDAKDYSKFHLNEFDLLLCNPPYFKVEEKSSLSQSYEKMIARHEVLFNLQDLCNCAKKLLKDNGNICIVHRSDRLMDVLEIFRSNNLEPKRIKFIYENLEKESYMVLVEAQKCGKSGLKVEKPLVLYNLDGSITDEYKLLQEKVIK